MAILPTILELYDEYKSRLESDPDHTGKDWSAGSWLDAFGSVAAVAGQSIMRWSTRRFLTAFVTTAEGSALDFVGEDRYGLSREAGETADEYRTRILEYVANLARATVPALEGWARTLDGVEGVSLDETVVEGNVLVTITLELDGTETEADVLQQFADEKDDWRAYGITTNSEAA